MASSTFHISNLLDKMSSVDKDFRFMATNDLIIELQKDSIKLDDEMERKIVKMILKLLEDKNGEVQNLAVKCLGPLVLKIKPYHIEGILDTLCSNMLVEQEELRDISSIALKTVINNFPNTYMPFFSNISQKLISNLIKIINRKDDTAIQLEVLDIVSDILSRFGSYITAQQAVIEEALIPLLSSGRLAVRKRSALALSYLTIICSPQLFNKVIKFLMDQIVASKSPPLTQSLINCIGAISRTSGIRLNPYVPHIVPILLSVCEKYSNTWLAGSAPPSSFNNEENDETIEHCLLTFDSMLRSCNEQMSIYVKQLTDLSLKFIEYDPNYNYGNSGEIDDDNEYMDSQSTEFKTEDNNNYEDDFLQDGDEQGDDSLEEDDEDMSWKVRRASAKCLKSLIENMPKNCLPFYYEIISPKLIFRFKEREDNVKIDIIHVYLALLKQTRNLLCSQGSSADADSKYVIHKPYMEYQHENIDCGANQSDGMELTDAMHNRKDDLENIVCKELKKQIPSLIRNTKTLIRAKNPKIRQAIFALLTDLVITVPGNNFLRDYLSTLMAGIVNTLLEETNTPTAIKIDALIFLAHLIISHNPTDLYPYMNQIISALLKCINDSFYKIVAESLTVTELLIPMLRPTIKNTEKFDFKPFIKSMCEAVMKRLNVTDIDQEVKEKSITCMARLIQYFGDTLTQSNICDCLNIFNDRMKNEITRVTTVKAIKMIIESPYNIFDISSQNAMEYIQSLSQFLRKSNRTLKITSLSTLASLIASTAAVTARDEHLHAQLEDLIAQILLPELPGLITDNDLRVTDLVFNLLTELVKVYPDIVVNAWNENKLNKGDYKNNLTQSISLITYSPLLQGDALYSMLTFFQYFVLNRSRHLITEIIDLITLPIYHQRSQQQEHRHLSSTSSPSTAHKQISSSSSPKLMSGGSGPGHANSNTMLVSQSPPITAVAASYDPMMENLNSTSVIHKQALVNVSKVIAVIAHYASTVVTIPKKPTTTSTTLTELEIELGNKHLNDLKAYIDENRKPLDPAATSASNNLNNALNTNSSNNNRNLISTDPAQFTIPKLNVIFATLCLGEIGKKCDLYTFFESRNEDICALFSTLFKCPFEDLKFGATYALGNIGSGNLSKFISFILSEILGPNNRQYVSLYALKEILYDRSSTNCNNIDKLEMKEMLKPIWRAIVTENGGDTVNLKLMGISEEGTRNVISECLGEMAIIEPENIISLLSDTLKHLNKTNQQNLPTSLDDTVKIISPTTTSINLAKCTILAAIITCVSSSNNDAKINGGSDGRENVESPTFYDDKCGNGDENDWEMKKVNPSSTLKRIKLGHPFNHCADGSYYHDKVDTILKPLFPDFLACLKDPDLNVRKISLILLNCAAHNKPWLVRDILSHVMPLLYNETKIRKELVREVEMGPFKHSVDDGLELRKTSYECMYTLLDSPTCFEKLDLQLFLDHVETGLKDHYDIKMLTYLMLARLAVLCPPTFILERVNRLLEPIKQVLNSKVKANSVKQEYEKQEELKRCAIRAATSIFNLTDADKSLYVIEFLNTIKGNPEWNALYESLNRDNSHNNNNQ